VAVERFGVGWITHATMGKGTCEHACTCIFVPQYPTFTSYKIVSSTYMVAHNHSHMHTQKHMHTRAHMARRGALTSN
jgi:hypothetical protein